jgi:alpha-beta hydrolase superfamily lysophospholipase
MNNIYQKGWNQTPEPKAAILLVHGLGEHCERYQRLGEFLNLSNYCLYSMDLPGHGQSAGHPGHIDRFNDYCDVVLSRYQQIKRTHPELPIYLLGHSMGGLIATKVLLDHQTLFAGALLSGAAIESPQAPPTWQVLIIKFISKVRPQAPMLALDASGVSRDAKVVTAYEQDPLVHHGKLSARLLAELTNAMQDCQTRAQNITLPIKIMHGGADVMTSPSGSEYLYQNVASQDKSISIYDNLYHEIFNEPEAQDIYTEMVEWLDDRSTKGI